MRRWGVLLLALAALVLTGCGAVQDWASTGLPGAADGAAGPTAPAAPSDAEATAAATPTPTPPPTPTPESSPSAEVVEQKSPPKKPEKTPETPEPTAEPEPEPELVAGPPIWQIGASGDDVRELQARLRQIQWFNQDPTGYFGDVTAGAVSGFQAKRGFPVVGYVDQRTWDRIVSMTFEPARDELYPPPPEPEPEVAQPAPGLDQRCLTGRAICIDKSQSVVRWVVNGQVQLTLDARFGSELLPTREGLFSVQRKVRDEYSRLYDNAPMPLAVYFSGGQAVHYSPDFVANGYNGSSHGCVNTRSWDGMSALFNSAQIGDKVVVYWS
jgi:peptidoglycan hydrolase-like protein with peptidoglycan-binding domain